MSKTPYIEHFDSVSQFAGHIEAISNRPEPQGGCGDSSLEHTNSDFPSFDAVLQAAKNGGEWANGARALQSISLDKDSTGTTIGPRTRADVVGGRPHIGRHLSGHPRAMVRVLPTSAAKKYIKIEVSISAAYGISDEKLRNRGRAIMAAVEHYELMNYAIEIVASFAMRDHDRTIHHTSITLKEPDAGWNASTAAFVFASELFMRCLMFRLMERTPEMSKVTHHDYGSPADSTRSMQRQNNVDVYLPAVCYGSAGSENWDNPETALTYVKQLIDKTTKGVTEDV